MSYDFWDRTALVVESDVLVRRNTRRLLTKHGMTVFEASDAIEALELLSEGYVELELLIQDLKIADIVGLHLAHTLRSVRPELPIIFMSSYVDEPSARAAFKEDGWSFLAKPFSATDLLARCATALEPGSRA